MTGKYYTPKHIVDPASGTGGLQNPPFGRQVTVEENPLGAAIGVLTGCPIILFIWMIIFMIILTAIWLMWK